MANEVETELKHIKDVVFNILRQSPSARNSDNFLYLVAMNHYLTGKMVAEPIMLTAVNIRVLPPLDSLRRLRQIIQNEECKFLPTIEDVIKRRRIREEAIRAWAVDPDNERENPKTE